MFLYTPQHGTSFSAANRPADLHRKLTALRQILVQRQGALLYRRRKTGATHV